MDSSTTVQARRQVNFITGLAIVLIFVSGLLQGPVPFVITCVGAALAIIGWAYAMITAARVRAASWLVLLVIGLAIAVAGTAYSFLLADAGLGGNVLSAIQLGVFPLAFIALCFGVLGMSGALERGVAAFHGGWALLTLVIGGTLVGGAIGTNIGAAAEYINALGFRLYAVACILGLIAWVVGLVVGMRTKAWGWFAVVVLLPAIGAFMFGLFGPTRQDVVMAQENARQRKAAGFV